jgi:hypothetical protein
VAVNVRTLMQLVNKKRGGEVWVQVWVHGIIVSNPSSNDVTLLSQRCHVAHVFESANFRLSRATTATYNSPTVDQDFPIFIVESTPC